MISKRSGCDANLNHDVPTCRLDYPERHSFLLDLPLSESEPAIYACIPKPISGSVYF